MSDDWQQDLRERELNAKVWVLYNDETKRVFSPHFDFDAWIAAGYPNFMKDLPTKTEARAAAKQFLGAWSEDHWIKYRPGGKASKGGQHAVIIMQAAEDLQVLFPGLLEEVYRETG